MVYLLLRSSLNVEGVKWPAGPRVINDDGWIRLLRERGAEVITEKQYEELIASKTAAPAAQAEPTPTVEPQEPPKDTEEAPSGENDTDDGRGDQGPALDPLNSHQPRRTHRRVPRSG